MTNPQTEARAIAQDIVDGFHPMDDVPVHMIADVAERIIAAALAAKDAELAELREKHRQMFGSYTVMQARAERVEAQLAEKNKALDRIIDIHVRNFGRQDEKIADILPIARRAREQGGQND